MQEEQQGAEDGTAHGRGGRLRWAKGACGRGSFRKVTTDARCRGPFPRGQNENEPVRQHREGVIDPLPLR